MQKIAKPHSFKFEKSKLSALAWGDKDAPLWIALHGWMDNSASFIRIAPIIASNLKVRIIAIDFSGHGLSRHRPPRSEYSMWSYCHDVLDALEELGNPVVTLLGHSLGAGVANILAAIYPDSIKGIVLIDGLLGRLIEPENLINQLRDGISGQRRALPSEKRYQCVEEAINLRVQKSLLPITPCTVGSIVTRSLSGNSQNGYKFTIDRQIATPRPVAFTQAQATAILSGIKCPCLLIQGTQGIVPKRDTNHSCRDSIKRLTIIELEGGHHLHLAKGSADTVAAEIVAWHKQHYDEIQC